MKLCKVCGEEKSLNLFYSYQRKARKSICYTADCKDCFNARTKTKREANPELKKKQATAYKAKLEGDPEFRAKRIAKSREWYAANKERHKKYGKEYREQPERVEIDRLRKAAWNKSPAGRAYFATRIREFRSTADGKLTDSFRKLISRTVEATGGQKISTTELTLGFSKEMLRQRMECQFRPGMTWSNHGEWHIDHKKPVSAFIRQGIVDPKLVNALSNLQPLWAFENLAKSDTWEPMTAANDNGVISIAA